MESLKILNWGIILKAFTHACSMEKPIIYPSHSFSLQWVGEEVGGVMQHLCYSLSESIITVKYLILQQAKFQYSS